ncbi:MAG: ATP-binding protein [Bacteroidetes bacterium]|nr:MAG: ATP-binding protein [Bacteroidota bacterium]
MQKLIEQMCKDLRIGNIVSKNYQNIEADSYEEFLYKVLKSAVEEREINRKNRLLKLANFPVFKTFENYSFEDIQIPKKISLDELKQGEFIQRKENLILYGGVGVGKTHMATAIGMNLINQGKNVKFFKTPTLVNMLSEAKKEGILGNLIKKISRADLIILDEWGYIPLDNNGAQLLFQIVADFYEKKSVIITTNLDFNSWNSVFYDEKLTAAIIDRLIHHSHLIIFTGKSHRLKNSLMK